jgi:hypothetical protein
MLWFGRVSRIHPGGQSAEESIRFCITVLEKEKRRTGARVFIRSGAVGDDPLIFVERNIVVLKIF